MDISDLKGVVGKVAPVLASALGTPAAGAAVAALCEVFGLKSTGSTEDNQKALLEAVNGATADQVIAMKKADQDFAVQMEGLSIKREEVASADRDSARKRESEVKDHTPRNLAYALVAGFFTVLGMMFFVNVPTSTRDLLNIMLGMLGTSFVSVITYYFGSTNGSAKKTELLAQSIPADKK